MADSFKKVIDTTVNMHSLTGTQAATLLTTGVGESAVLKDFQLRGDAYGNTFNIKMNGYTIMENMATGTLFEGTQIVPESSTVTMETVATTVAQKSVIRMFAEGDSGGSTSSTDRYGDIDSLTGVISSMTNSPINGDSSTHSMEYYYKHTDGSEYLVYLRMSGNNTNYLTSYKINADGTTTQIYNDNKSYAGLAYDTGTQYMYAAKNGDLERVDVTTGTLTSIWTGASIGTSSYPNASVIKNSTVSYFVAFTGTSPDQFFVYDLTNSTFKHLVSGGSMENRVGNATQRFDGVIQADGKLLLYLRNMDTATGQAYNHSYNLMYWLIDPEGTGNYQTSYMISLTGTFGGGVNFDSFNTIIFGGYKILGDKAYFYHTTTAAYETTLARCDYNNTTRTIDFTTYVNLGAGGLGDSSKGSNTDISWDFYDLDLTYANNPIEVMSIGIESN